MRVGRRRAGANNWDPGPATAARTRRGAAESPQSRSGGAGTCALASPRTSPRRPWTRSTTWMGGCAPGASHQEPEGHTCPPPYRTRRAEGATCPRTTAARTPSTTDVESVCRCDNLSSEPITSPTPTLTLAHHPLPHSAAPRPTSCPPLGFAQKIDRSPRFPGKRPRRPGDDRINGAAVAARRMKPRGAPYGRRARPWRPWPHPAARRRFVDRR